jgi:hypothetical protein
VNVAQSSNGVGSINYNWTPTATGNYGFRVHFVKGNSNYNNYVSDCTTLEVVASCDGPTITSSVVANGSNSYTVTWTVCACSEEMTDVKLKGGLINGVTTQGTPTYDVTPTEVVNRGQNNTNPNITWRISSIPAGECISRSVTYTVPSNVTSGEITGGWSAEFDTDSAQDQRIETDPVVIP